PPGRPRDRSRRPSGTSHPPLHPDDGAGDHDALPDDHAQSPPNPRLPATPAAFDDPPRSLPGSPTPEDIPARPPARPGRHDVGPRLRPHEAARGPRGPAGRPSRFRRRTNPRGPQSEPAGDGSRRIPKLTPPGPHR